MTDIAAVTRELIERVDRIAAAMPVVAAERGNITDEDDLKMLDWMTSSIPQLRELTTGIDTAAALDANRRHAIRNCLNAIKGGSQLLIEGAPDNGLDPASPAAAHADELIAHSDAILLCLETARLAISPE